MKKSFVLVVAALLIVALAVGCTPAPEGEQEMMPEDKEMTGEEEMMPEDKEMTGEEEMVEGYIDVSPEKAKELIDTMPDIMIIDVSPKYDAGHLPGAVNYYVGDGSLDEAIPTLDKSKTYLVYCHADGPSISGATKLVEAGFQKVYRLEGNYAAWVDAGYPIEK